MKLPISQLFLTSLFLSLTANACSQTHSENENTHLAANQPVISSVAAPVDELTQNTQTENTKSNSVFWHVIKAESFLKFTASQQGESFTGKFSNFNVDILFDAANLPAARVKAVIDLSSAQAGDKDRDNSLPSKEWFYIKKFPQAVFEAKNFTHHGEHHYQADGRLSMKGITRPLSLPFTLVITDNGQTEMRAALALDRTIWNVGSGQWASGEWVSTQIDLDIKITAIRP